MAPVVEYPKPGAGPGPYGPWRPKPPEPENAIYPFDAPAAGVPRKPRRKVAPLGNLRRLLRALED